MSTLQGGRTGRGRVVPARSTARVGARVLAGLTVAVLALGACSSDPPPTPEPGRAQRVVVTVDVPFRSLNADTADGRAPGSVLVRGLVQDGFVALDASGAAVPDPSFGTVEKVSDDPLTVRYTLSDDARWSDGVAVTGADLVLEWAARSGALDDVVPELGDDGEVVNGDALDAGVAFAATSRALVHAQVAPTVDDEGRVTVVYAQPVPDWQVALDVNVPAHVLGRSALGVEDDAAAARAVVDAVTAPATHHDDLVALSRAWRTAWDDDALAASTADAVTTGPYVVTAVREDASVELARNEHYAGSRPARFDTVTVRADVHPLDQVSALAAGDVDVVAPVATADVLDALADADADVVVGGDAAWQLVVRAGAFGAPTTSADDRQAARLAWLSSVPRDDVRGVAQALWPAAEVDEAVLASVGDGAGRTTGGAAGTPAAGPSVTPTSTPTSTQTAPPTAPPTPGATTGPTPAPTGAPTGGTDAAADAVRVLANTADPLRAAVVDLVADASAATGVEVTRSSSDPTTGLWADPDGWDVAIVPVVQDELPVASLLDRWRTGGATNVTQWSDEPVDALLATLATQTAPDDQATTEAALATRLRATGAVLPLVHAPALTATRGARVEGLPDVGDVALLRLARADLTDWWGWATQS